MSGSSVGLFSIAIEFLSVCGIGIGIGLVILVLLCCVV